MRKKKILEENLALFKQLRDAKAEIEELKAQIRKLEEQISDFKKQDEEKKEEKVASAPLKELEKKVQKSVPEIPEDLQFASEIIGEIVIESARYGNMLTIDGETKYKELVNLILGKTEVAKADILAITKESIPLEQKKEKIVAVKQNAVEYFDVVMAQR